MKFGEFPLSEVAGGYLAHSVKLGKGMLAKGRRLTEDDLQKLEKSGITHVMAALFEPGDISEDAAAARIARHVAGDHVAIADAFTGRVNLFAAEDGVVTLDEAAISALNHVHEAVTLATISPNAIVAAGQLIATVKIIPLAVEERIIGQITGEIDRRLITLHPFRRLRAIMIQTALNGTAERKFDKARRVMGHRLALYNTTLTGDVKCPHGQIPLADALRKAADGAEDMILIMGASAITDRRDVIPAAIERAGGAVIHYGMPVDPGNLMLVAKLGDKWVLGLPGCSRSPKLNGIDLILSRIAAGLALNRGFIMGLGVGGLLSEYPGRPQPREGRRKTVVKAATAPRIAALVLAAGQSRRMGAENKLLLPYQGQTVLSHVVEQVRAAGISDIHIVTGHQKEQVENETRRHGVSFIHNDLYADGMSTSVRLGIRSLPRDMDGALIILGDMPEISAPVLKKIIAAFNPVESRSIIIPIHDGKRGNPILWAREFFDDFESLDGDKGAKVLLGKYADDIHELEIDSDAIFFDIDTLDAYQRLSQKTDPDRA